jgi:hypothetical protein
MRSARCRPRTLSVLLLIAAGLTPVVRAQEPPAVEPSPPGGGAAAPAPAAPTRADYQQRAAALRVRAPAGFAIVVEPPFVVAGEGGEATVRRHAERTVRWAVRLLRAGFFARDPDRILDIWLFDGDQSYRKHARMLFGDVPTTPYGYYSARHGALIMNIATGGGTLVHEIVHPFVAANCPGCPAWLNEGLGSLFEQCRERDGHIEGMVNWRLDGLQAAIREQRTIPLADLVATDDATFYGPRSGLHYAMARYLLLWLQERSALRGFWRDHVAGRDADPTGKAALLRALGTDDLRTFQREWERWVMELRRG